MKFSRETLGALLLAGGLLLGLWLFAPTHRVWLSLVSSVTSVTTTITHATQRLFASDQSLTSQLALCEDDRAHLTALLAQAKIAEAERDELTKLLHVTQASTLSGQVAHVIFRTVEQDPATVLIDKGTADGLAVQDVVIAGEGFLFGTVVSVSHDSAVVRLVLHPDSQIPVMTQGSHQALGIAVGTDGTLINLKYIPKDAALDEGDVVVTSGREGIFPPNILLGTVKNISRDERNPFYDANVILPTDPLMYSVVFVLRRPST